MSIERMNATYGASEVRWGMGSNAFAARTFLNSERFFELDRRQGYFDCTQHDRKGFDFDGRIIPSGKHMTTQPLISSEKASWYVPLKERRPSAPYRLARTIVHSFTNMLFGEHRFPQVRVEGDPRTQDFAQALVRATRLPMKMIRARNLGGSMGSVGLSWCYFNGYPRVQVHNPKNVFIHEWTDRDELIPRHVTELYLTPRDEFDPAKKRYVRNWYWFRRDWLPDADLVFKESLFTGEQDPFWEVDYERSVVHQDGMTHFVWMQNQPTDETDGLHDFDGLEENFDTMDVLLSVITRGTTLNLDPTLVLAMDVDLVQRMGVKKGSDNALIVGAGGAASYLEMTGTGITQALNLFEKERVTALEVAQCVVPDSATIAAQGISSVALKAIYAPMLGKCETYREQYGSGLQRLIGAMLAVARATTDRRVVVYVENAAGEPEEVEVELEVKLPPRIEKRPGVDEFGDPTGTDVMVAIPRVPGDGGELELRWGPYFIPTPDDQTKIVQVVSMATGGKPTMSQRSGVEVVTQAFGIEPDEEWKRVQAMAAEAAEKQAAMFGEPGAAGGQVGDENELPPGASHRALPENTGDEYDETNP